MGNWEKVIIKPTGIIAEVQIGDKTFTDVSVKGEWEGLVKLEAPYKQGHLIGGKPNIGGPDLFAGFFQTEKIHMFFEEVEISPIRASGDFLEAVKPKEEKEQGEKENETE